MECSWQANEACLDCEVKTDMVEEEEREGVEKAGTGPGLNGGERNKACA